MKLIDILARAGIFTQDEWQAAVDALAAQSSEAAKDMHDTAVNAQNRDGVTLHSDESHPTIDHSAEINSHACVGYCTDNVSIDFNYASLTESVKDAHWMLVNKEWSGEGLPPVGARVESGSRRNIGANGSLVEHDLHWSEAVVIAHGVADGTCFVIAQGDNEIHVGQAEAMLAAAPQPPALGGEPEATAWIISDEDGTIDATVRWDVAKHSFGEAMPMISKAVHRAHLAPLQAEIARLKEESFEGLYNAAIDERDQLKARCDAMAHALTHVRHCLDDDLPEDIDYRLVRTALELSKPAGSNPHE